MTLTELYRKTLQRLMRLEVGSDPTADDARLIADRYASLYTLLFSDNHVSWAFNEEPPDEAEIPLVSMLAFYCAAEFARDPETFKLEGALNLSPSEGGPSRAEKMLRKLNSVSYISETAQSEYF
jgi:hypothetical protein